MSTQSNRVKTGSLPRRYTASITQFQLRAYRITTALLRGSYRVVNRARYAVAIGQHHHLLTLIHLTYRSSSYICGPIGQKDLAAIVHDWPIGQIATYRLRVSFKCSAIVHLRGNATETDIQ